MQHNIENLPQLGILQAILNTMMSHAKENGRVSGRKKNTVGWCDVICGNDIMIV